LSKNGNSWELKAQGAKRASLKSSTKEKAISEMREFMSSREGSVKIRKEDGTIQEERTYPRSSDPSSTRG
jgi:hypothetical protein